MLAVRVDGDADPRSFISDIRAVETSELAAKFYDVVTPEPVLDLEDEDDDESAARPEGEPGGDDTIAADLGTTSEELLDAVRRGGQPARRRHLRGVRARRLPPRCSRSCAARDARGTRPMRAALALAVRALPAGDVPIGAVVLDAGGRRRRRGLQRARADRRPDRARRDPRAAPGGRAARRVAADRAHAGGHARAVHDVRGRRGPGPGRAGGLRGATTPRPARSARCGTSYGTGGSTTAPRSSAACSRTSRRSCCARSSPDTVRDGYSGEPVG